MSPPIETPKSTRSKVSAEVRQKRITALEEDIANLDKQLHFKNKRLQQAENIKNYKLCEDITEEIQVVTRQRRELREELQRFREKERKSRWYQRTKNAQCSASNATSDDSDIPMSSPGSSRASSREVVMPTVASDSEHSGDEGSADVRCDNCNNCQCVNIQPSTIPSVYLCSKCSK